MGNDSGHWMPFYWADYFADTTHLTTQQHGAYVLLIGTYWRRGNALPDDRAFLSSTAKMTVRAFKIVEDKLSDMFVIIDGLWYHSRVEKELLSSSERLKSARANGRAGGLATGLAKSQLSITTPTKEQESKILIARFQAGKKIGNGEGHTTIKDPTERLNRFQKWLAGKIGANGWVIVASAADPGDPDYLRSLILCQQTAKSHGKGWPKQWPATPNNQ